MAEPAVDLAERISELSKNAQAGVALVTAAVLDEWLQKLLLTAMRDISSTVADRIFGSFRPLYELAPKADIAFALSLIDDETLAILRIIRDIRNVFAHTRVVINFDSDEIAKLCRKFPDWKAGSSNLELFNHASVTCAVRIDTKTNQLIFDQATPSDASRDR